MDKDPKLIIHTDHPLNAEPPLDSLRENFITPQKLFYVRNHGEIPEIDIDKYRLHVNGLVEREMQLSFEMLTAFPRQSVMATMQCAGNRRDELIDVAPIPGELPWHSGAIGNAVWTGVPLNEILKAAGIKPEAAFVAFTGADEVFRHGKNVGFGASIPIAKALTSDVLLAYEMNGKPLEPAHGFPIRAVVPGYIGARSVKWLTQITLQIMTSENYFQDHAYKLFPPEVNADTVDWNLGLQLSELGLNCVITTPLENAIIQGAGVTIQGYAMSGGDHKIQRVDVSADGGKTWTGATITEGEALYTWVFWELHLKLDNGTHEIAARAFDDSTNEQPENAVGIWNFKGYMNNAWHRVRFQVSE